MIDYLNLKKKNTVDWENYSMDLILLCNCSESTYSYVNTFVTYLISFSYSVKLKPS